MGRAISEYMLAIRPTATWAVAVEWTNTELEQTFRAGRDVIALEEQTISASAGLGAYLVNRYV